MLTDPQLNLGAFMGQQQSEPPADILLRDGETLCVGSLVLQILHTPGHTPGGISLYLQAEGIVFAGDALFRGSIGRTDFPRGNHERLLESIRDKLLTLPDETIVYPGHGPATTIGAEKRGNPWLWSPR